MRPPSRRAVLRTVAAGVLAGSPGSVTAAGHNTTDDSLPLRETVSLDADRGAVSDLVRTADGSLAAVILDEGGYLLGLDEYGRRTLLTPVTDTSYLHTTTSHGANTLFVGGENTDDDSVVGAFHLEDGWVWRMRLPETADRVVGVHELPDGNVFVASSIPTPSGADSDLFWVDPNAGTVERQVNLDEEVTQPSVSDSRVAADGSVTVIAYGYNRARGVALRYDAEGTRIERTQLGSQRNIASDFLVTSEGYLGVDETDDENVVFTRFDAGGTVESKTVVESPHSLSPRTLLGGVDGRAYAVGSADQLSDSGERCFVADATTGTVTTTEVLPDGVDTEAFFLVGDRSSPALVAGGTGDAGTERPAWLGTFSDQPSPTATPSETPTPTATETPTPTPTTMRTPISDTSTTTTPGFSLATVAGALGLGVAELLRRDRD